MVLGPIEARVLSVLKVVRDKVRKVANAATIAEIAVPVRKAGRIVIAKAIVKDVPAVVHAASSR